MSASSSSRCAGSPTGGTAFDPEVVAQLMGRRRRDDPLSELTPREREVLALMAEGLSNSAIAKRLWLTVGAVEKHISSIFARLGLLPRRRREPARPGRAHLPGGHARVAQAPGVRLQPDAALSSRLAASAMSSRRRTPSQLIRSAAA